MPALIDAYDAALFDLDGVIYLGPEPVPGAADALAALRERRTPIAFVTNNAARSPRAVADHLMALSIAADAGDVVISSQAGARLLAERLPAAAPVLVVGTGALEEQVRLVGLRPVDPDAEQPAGVIQGYHPELRWAQIDEAAYAIQRGAVWVATNTDATRPTDRGLVPGAGAQVGAVRAAVAVDPLVAGKPCPPLLTETVRRLGAARPIFVGDRIDTDIDGAAAVGIDSLFVFTGAHGKAEIIAATHRPTHLGLDLRALLQRPAVVRTDTDRACCGEAMVVREATRWSVRSGAAADEQLDALRCLVALVEPGTDPRDPQVAPALAALDRLR